MEEEKKAKWLVSSSFNFSLPSSSSIGLEVDFFLLSRHGALFRVS
jgi:hypothetical protein